MDLNCHKCGTLLISFKGNRAKIEAGDRAGNLPIRPINKEKAEFEVMCPKCGSTNPLKPELAKRFFGA
jgi:ribosomal protein S27E